MGFIYQLLNEKNSKRYIGQTRRTPEIRLKSHLTAAHRGSSTYLHTAIRQTGAEFFKLSIIEEIDNTELNDREIFWISEIRPEYNLTPGGDGLPLGYKHSAEARLKMSIAQRGRPHVIVNKRGPMTSEQKEKIRQSLLGHTVSTETRQKLSDAHTGKVHTTETVRKRAKSLSATIAARPDGHWSRGKPSWNAGLTGRHFYNNGITEVIASTCPDGFTAGRLRR